MLSYLHASLVTRERLHPTLTLCSDGVLGYTSKVGSAIAPMGKGTDGQKNGAAIFCSSFLPGLCYVYLP